MPRPIVETLHHLEGGCLMDDAAERLAQLVLDVDQTGKKGSITIKIELRKATAGALAVTGDIKVSAPARPKVEALLFATPEGNLLSEDPRQQKLELKAIDNPTATAELRTVAQ